MGTTEIVILVVVVLVVLAVVAAVLAAQRKRRSEHLRSTFGPEYDRTVDSSGRRRDAEKDLAARADRRSSLDIRPLSEADRQAFAARWTETQADFVDRPAEAVTSADVLVTEVMRKRGYPVGDFDQQARDVSVDHAEVVHEYRSAHDISLLNDRQQATTEQLRQAMVHYRALFSELLGDQQVAQAAPPVYPTDAQDRSRTSSSHRDLPDHDLSDRDLAYLDRADREPSGRHLDDRDAVLGGGRQDERSQDRVDEQAERRFEANHDGAYDGTDRALGGGPADPGYATDEDRRVSEGGLTAEREQRVVHVRRERLDGGDDRDLPPRG